MVHRSDLSLFNFFLNMFKKHPYILLNKLCGIISTNYVSHWVDYILQNISVWRVFTGKGARFRMLSCKTKNIRHIDLKLSVKRLHHVISSRSNALWSDIWPFRWGATLHTFSISVPVCHCANKCSESRMLQWNNKLQFTNRTDCHLLWISPITIRF